MSTVVDQRVAELRFDNQHFEKNVSQTLSTLDKLKEKLHLTGASKGLENIGAAANKVNMSGLGAAVQTVGQKFTALEVMGVTALANITNSAVNAGKRMVSALTIDPVKTGWNEYELKMGSIQTIMASTGESLDSVNKYLNELNEYSDKTIYSFSDMTQNIGKFTNAGVKLEDAVLAIKGISNEAALSGANANEASRAMYNFAQALSAGYVKLIDWKSIELANMATVGFKNELIAAAVEAGTLKEAGDGLYKTLSGSLVSATHNFNDSLKDEWMTTEVLIGTLKDYADETTDIGKKATQAATEVKTFSQMLDALKESAQSGWAQTWEIIFGDFEEGKTLWTNINNVVDGFLDKMSDARNALVTRIFGNSWDKLVRKIEDAGLSAKDFEDTVKEIGGKHVEQLINEFGSLSKAVDAGRVSTDLIKKAFKKFTGVEEDVEKATDDVTTSVKDLGEIVKKVMRGDFANGETRVRKLTEAGYDWATVQNKVNELLGSSVRHISTLTEEQLANANSLSKLSEEQLKAKGYTFEQISALKALGYAFEDADSDVNKLINSMSKPSGRTLVIETFSNVFEHFSNILKIVGEAWNDVFGEIDFGQSLYNAIEQMHAFSESLKISEENANNFRTVMKGLLDGFKLTGSIASMSVVGSLKILNAVLGLFGTDLLGVASHLASYISAFEDWVEVHTMFGYDTAYDKIAEVLVAIYDGLSRCIKAFLGLEKVQGIIKKFKDLISDLFGSFDGAIDFFSIDGVINTITTFFDKIEAYIKGGNEAENLGLYLIQGLSKGILKAGQSAITAILDIAKTLITSFCDFFGIASPSKLMIAMGIFLIMGLTQGISESSGFLWDSMKSVVSHMMTIVTEVIQNGIPYVIELVKTLIPGILDTLKQIDLGTIIATGFGVGSFVIINKMVNAFDKLVSPLEGLAGMFKSIGGLFDTLKKGFEQKMKARMIEKIGDAVLHMAIAIGILAASLWLISKINIVNLWESVAVLAALAGIVAALAGVTAMIDKFSKVSKKGAKTSLIIVGMAASILILAIALKKLDSIEDVGKTIGVLTAMIIGLLGFVAVMSQLTRARVATNIHKAGEMLLKLSIALLILTFVIDRIGDLNSRDIIKGLVVIGVLELFCIGLVKVSGKSGEHASKAGGMLIKLSIALIILIGVIKLIGFLREDEIIKGLNVIGLIGIMFSALMGVSQYAGDNAGKAGWMFIGAAAGIAAIALCIKTLSKLSVSEITKGMVAIILLGVMFAMLIDVSYYAGEHAAKAGAMLLMISGAMLILTGVLFVISKLEPKGLWRAVGIVSILAVLFAGLIAVTYIAKDSDGINKVLVKLMITLILLTAVLIALTYLDQEKLKNATGALTAIIGVFALLISSMQYLKTGKKTFTRNLATLSVLVAIVAGLAGVLIALSHLADPESLIEKASALSILLATLSGALVIISHSKSMSANKMKTMMQALGWMTLVIGGLSVIMLALDHIKNPTGLIPTVTALTILLTAMTGAMVVLSNFATKTMHLGDVMTSLLVMTAIVAVLSGTMLILDQVKNPTGLIPTVTAMTILITAMTGAMVAFSNFATKTAHLNKVMGALLVMTAIVAILSGVMIILDQVKDPTGLIPTVTAMTILIAAMTGAMTIFSNFATKTAHLSKVMGALLVMTAIVAVLSGVIIILDQVKNPIGLIPTVTAMSVLINAMAFAMSILSNGVTKTAKLPAIMEAMAIMTALLVGLSVVFLLLSEIENPMGLVPTAIALGVLLNAMSVALVILNTGIKTTTNTGSAIAALVMLGLVVGELAIILGLMSKLDAHAAVGDVVALSTLLVVMTGVLVVLGAAAGYVSMATPGIVALGMLSIVVGILAGILGIMSAFDIHASLEDAASLSLLLLAMSGSLAILSIVGAAAPAAIAGIGTLLIFVGALAALLAALGGLSKIDGFNELINGGMELLSQLGYALGDFVGSILAGFSDGIASGLPALGESLGQFMTNAKPFLEGIKMVDNDMLGKVATLSGAILALTAADLINGLASFFSFGSSFADLGAELSQFIINAMPFIMGISMVNPTALASVKVLAEAIRILTNTDLTNSLTSFISGGDGIAEFGSQLGELGSNLRQFATNLGTFDDATVSTVKCGCEAIKAIADAAKTLPNEGGWIAAVLGDNSLATFSARLPYLGANLASFVRNIGTFDKEQVNTVDCAGKAIKAIADAASMLPNEGGWIAAVLGDNSLATFSGKLPGLGSDLAAFVTNLGTFTDEQVSTVDCAGRAIKALAESAKDIPNEGGWIAAIVGDNSLATFGEKLPALATSIKGFVKELGNFDETTITSVETGISVIKSVAKLGEVDLSSTASGLSSLGNKLETFAGKMSNFVSKMNEVATSDVQGSVTKIQELIDLAKTAAEVNVDSLSTFGNTLVDVATKSVDNFVKAFTNFKPKNDVSNAAKDLLAAFVAGLTDKETTVTKKFTAIAEDGVSKLSTQSIISKAKSAGKDVVQGFADGISLNNYISNKAAKAMAKAAAQAAEDELDINSPSKVFRAIAYSIPEGFAMGIDKMAYMASDSSVAMGQNAIRGVKDAIARVSAYMNEDIDAQPTIRPVLDLSDVRTGIGALSGMFDTTANVGLISNVNSISSMMNRRNQNGANSDVISAIKDLGQSLGTRSGDTYNVNGITYDDGSNVAEAVKVLTRAAVRERRI